MTVSTNGQICYGVLLPEETEQPWDCERWDYDIKNWWISEICGYSPPFQLYDDDGDYLSGKKPSEEVIQAYYKPRAAFRDAHPIPVSVVNCCSGDYPMWIVAVPGSVKTASRGFPQRLEPSELLVTEEQVRALVSFCDTCGIAVKGNPQWWLSSYWG